MKKTNGTNLATGYAAYGDGYRTESEGLTKREYFAAQALACLGNIIGNKDTARIAVEIADALITELNKDKKDE